MKYNKSRMSMGVKAMALILENTENVNLINAISFFWPFDNLNTPILSVFCVYLVWNGGYWRVLQK